MSRRVEEAAAFLATADREAYLLAHSGLPGPRGNLELIDVASAACDRADLERWARLSPQEAPENTPRVFLACVGMVGLGRLVAAGDRSLLPALRRSSNDPRWRVREAVAMALQAWGDVDPAALVDEMEGWATGSPLEGRAAMAALCEPRLLRHRGTIAKTLAILDRLTSAVRDAADPRLEDVRVLRQALGYGWSVAVAADPQTGLPALGRWLADPNPDVGWIVRQNLAKARLSRVAPEWVEQARKAAATKV
ncbi:MAG TPA: hypothetical protein VFW02_01895 [Candidatus Limnocylindrales bacterium]|nr:hypothetical protein [Candidatus Limnocylindrales bacterium]